MSVYLARTSFTVLSPLDDNPSIDQVWLAQPGATTPADLASAVSSSFGHVYTGMTNALATYLGKQVSRSSNSASTEIYDITAHLDGTPHGSPVAAHSFTPSNAGTDNGVPSGVAAAISFRSDYGSAVEFGPGTRPRSRLRNRFYWGPLVSSVLTQESTTNRVVFTNGFMQDATLYVAGVAELLVGGVSGWKLQTWSRKNATTEDVIESWMDDRPDYQRRRSDPSTVRVTQTVTETTP